MDRLGGARLGWTMALLLTPFVSGGTESAAGQSLPVGDPAESYLRVLQLAGLIDPGSFAVRPLLWVDSRGEEGPAHPWVGRPGLKPVEAAGRLRWSVDDARARLFFNSKLPHGMNDGAVWQGRGLTTAFDTRTFVAWRALSLTLNPLVSHNQNVWFELAPVDIPRQPAYAYPWWRLDYPQRFGAEGRWTFDLGDSRLALDWKAARVSFGNESMWWGPALRNALVMSNNAPGFLHGSVGTNQPVDIGIGDLEGRWIWGGLGQSDYFDPDANPDRFITGIVLTYSPSWLDGLALGMTRVFQQLVPDDGIDTSEYLLVFQGLVKASQVSNESPDGTDERDQLVSLFGRWVFPESGFEAYFEWARNDHAGDLGDLFQEPEHSQAYTLGFQKVTSFAPQRVFAFRGELTHLEAPPTFQLRPRGVYYTHSVVTQGYTHQGQILGAGIGPGSNAQFLGVDLYERWGSAGLFVQRRVHDNDAFWVWADETGATFDQHHVSLDIGLSGSRFLGDFDLGASFTFTRELNRYFFGPDVTNLNLGLTARWRQRAR